MASVFTKILSGEIPCYKIAEDENYLAFLDIQPLAEGHVLVIPKQEVDYLFKLDDEIYAGLWMFAKRISVAIEKSISCKRIGVAVIGLEVPHAHIHLIPLNTMNDINFSRPKLNPTKEQLEKTAMLIQQEL